MNWSFQRNGRSRRAVMGLILFVSLLLALRIWIHAAYGVLIVLSLFALPLVWNVLRNPVSGMDITENDLLWYSGTLVLWSCVRCSRIESNCACAI